MKIEEPLVYDPFYHYERIVVVGLGGTGSHVGRCIARLLYHRKQKQQQIPEVLFVDPDIVEPHNVGRQMFTEASIGKPKAQVLATNFNMALGLQIAWSQEPIDSRKHIIRGSLVCGCVDNHLARAEISRASNFIWLDAGNGYDFGQVVIGDSGDKEQVLHGLRHSSNNHCRHLPHVGLLFPSLLQPEVEEEKPEAVLSCAELVMRDEQHLYVNDFTGNIMAQYIYRLLNREPITTFATFLTLNPALNIKSCSITASELEAYFR